MKFRPRTIGRVLLMVVGIYSVIAFTGWVTGTKFLYTPVDWSVGMAFLTSAMFLISSVMIFLAHSKALNEHQQSAAAMTGSVALFLLSVNSINDHFTKTKADHILPSLSTLIAFLLVACSGLPVGSHKLRRLLGQAVGLLGALAVVGYFSGVERLYHCLPHIGVGIAFNTAMTFIALGMALYLMNFEEVEDE